MISVVLPTYNEAANLPDLLQQITEVLEGAFEVIVVDDDSPDGTWRMAEEMKKQYSFLRVIRRVGRRGLSSAVVEGFAAARGDVLMVMDADLQHNPRIITALASAIDEGADIAVASRYVDGGSVGSWVTGRRLLSKTATVLVRALPPVHVTDPMSGFFAIRRTTYEQVAPFIRPSGFKILFEILAFLPPRTRAVDVPLTFQMRLHGESKLSVGVEAAFLWQMLRVALLRIQWPLFAFICAAAAAILLPRAVALSPLYLSPSTRVAVSTTLSAVAEERGWLLSDMQVRAVVPDGVRVLHRRHHRGRDETECLFIRHEPLCITPCAD